MQCCGVGLVASSCQPCDLYQSHDNEALTTLFSCYLPLLRVLTSAIELGHDEIYI